jgi:mannose-6-phosphate isomerase-like protein (cupin superfamily)
VTEKEDLASALDAFIHAFSYPTEHRLLARNLPAHPVHVGADRGNAAAYFRFPEINGLEAHISEIPAGGATRTHRHTCEAFFYVISGRGYSAVRREDEPERQIAWQAGDLFCTPTQTWHCPVNLDPTRPARYLEITTIPLMKRLGKWRIEGPESRGSEG